MMTRFAFLLLISIALSSQAVANNWNNKSSSKANEPSFSKFIYGEEIGKPGCFHHRDVPEDTAKRYAEFLSYEDAKKVVGFDWMDDHSKNSTSLNVTHENISKPSRHLFALSQTAAATSEDALIQKAIQLAVELAETETLLNTPSLNELKGSQCYDGNGNTKAYCAFHVVQFAAQFAGNYYVSLSFLLPYMTDNQKEIVISYSESLFEKFVRPINQSLQKNSEQFSQMANMSLAVLYYAYITEDQKLAQKTFNKTFSNIDAVFLEDGYILGSSFRGVRGFWYHTYGTNGAMAVVHIANAWGVNIPQNIFAKVKKSSELINLGIADIDKFHERKSPTGKQKNASYNPADARFHVHQLAIAIDQLSQVTVGVDLNVEADKVYMQKRRSEYPNDWTIGFNPQCVGS